MRKDRRTGRRKVIYACMYVYKLYVCMYSMYVCTYLSVYVCMYVLEDEGV